MLGCAYLNEFLVPNTKPNQNTNQTRKYPQTWQIWSFHVTCFFLFTGMCLQKSRYCLVQCLLNSLTTWSLHNSAVPMLSTPFHGQCSSPHPRWHPGHSGECDLRDLMLPKWLPLRKWTGQQKMLSPAFFMHQYYPKYILAVTGLEVNLLSSWIKGCFAPQNMTAQVQGVHPPKAGWSPAHHIPQ